MSSKARVLSVCRTTGLLIPIRSRNILKIFPAAPFFQSGNIGRTWVSCPRSGRKIRDQVLKPRINIDVAPSSVLGTLGYFHPFIKRFRYTDNAILQPTLAFTKFLISGKKGIIILISPPTVARDALTFN